MTKRDFQDLASGLYEAKITPRERQRLAEIIAVVCAKNNASFNREKFFEACGTVQKFVVNKRGA